MSRYNNPTITTATTTARAVNSIPFPSVTICSRGINLTVFVAGIFRLLFDFNHLHEKLHYIGKNNTIYTLTPIKAAILYRKFEVEIIFILSFSCNVPQLLVKFHSFLLIIRFCFYFVCSCKQIIFQNLENKLKWIFIYTNTDFHQNLIRTRCILFLEIKKCIFGRLEFVFRT